MGKPKKLMVTIKLELADGVQVRWLDNDSKPYAPWKPLLRSVTLEDGTKLAVDSKHVQEACIPVKGQDAHWDAFFMGYWEIDADDPDQEKVSGKKGIPATYDLVFVDPSSNAVAEVGKHYEIVRAGKSAKFSAMG